VLEHNGARHTARLRHRGGLLSPHPNGIVIHPRARIGVNCLLFQQETIGPAGGGVPVLEHAEVTGRTSYMLNPVPGCHEPLIVYKRPDRFPRERNFRQ
jgi:hypothetical protein